VVLSITVCTSMSCWVLSRSTAAVATRRDRASCSSVAMFTARVLSEEVLSGSAVMGFTETAAVAV
jgi:hypothetical protein